MFSASERWNRTGSCGTNAIGLAQTGQGRPSNVLTVDQDAPGLDLVQALQQLDEGRLAAAGVPDQCHPLAGGDGDRQFVEQRGRVVAVMEAHALEADRAPCHDQWRGVRLIGDAGRGAVILDQPLHVVGRLLGDAQLHADVAQPAADQEEAGQHIGDVASAGLATGGQAGAPNAPLGVAAVPERGRGVCQRVTVQKPALAHVPALTVTAIACAIGHS